VKYGEGRVQTKQDKTEEWKMKNIYKNRVMRKIWIFINFSNLPTKNYIEKVNERVAVAKVTAEYFFLVEKIVRTEQQEQNTNLCVKTEHFLFSCLCVPLCYCCCCWGMSGGDVFSCILLLERERKFKVMDYFILRGKK